MSTGRDHDIGQLRQDYDRATSESARRDIRDTAMKIQNESGKVNSMREALIREHRSGNVENIKDIHDYIKNKTEYR